MINLVIGFSTCYQNKFQEVEVTTNVHEHGEHDCSCPKCGYEKTVGESVRCNEQVCPECGAYMRAKETGEYRA